MSILAFGIRSFSNVSAANHLAVAFAEDDFEDTPTGKAIMNLKAFAGELERERILERTMRGRKSRSDSGWLVPGNGDLYGYDLADEIIALDKVLRKAKYVVNPRESLVVKRIFHEYAVKGRSLRKVCAGLKDDGIPAPPRRQVASIHGQEDDRQPCL